MEKKAEKGLLMLGLLPLLASLLPSCAATYQLTVDNELGPGVISYPRSRRYPAGKKLEVVLPLIFDASQNVYLNEKRIPWISSGDSKIHVTFEMPAKDSSLVLSWDYYLFEKEFPFSYAVASLPEQARVYAMEIRTYDSWTDDLLSSVKSDNDEDIANFYAYTEQTITYEKDADPKGNHVEVILYNGKGEEKGRVESVGEYLYRLTWGGPDYFHLPGYHPEILHPVEEESSSVLKS